MCSNAGVENAKKTKKKQCFLLELVGNTAFEGVLCVVITPQSNRASAATEVYIFSALCLRVSVERLWSIFASEVYKKTIFPAFRLVSAANACVQTRMHVYVCCVHTKKQRRIVAQ